MVNCKKCVAFEICEYVSTDCEKTRELVNDICNKAIDNFVELCLKHKSKDDYPIMCFDEETIKKFAEQLKGGGEND